MKTIWLIGCGNIGFRHLQALVALPEPVSVLVIEPAVALHDRIRAEIATLPEDGHRVQLSQDLPETSQMPDLAIVATAAPPRAAIVHALTRDSSPRAVVLEKILAQTDAELDAMEGDLSATPTHVNCPRRYFPGYLALRDQLAPDRPLSVAVTGSQFGLGSNAVHFLDLLEFLNASPLVEVDGAGLDTGSKASKRAGFQEIYGTLQARAQNGASLAVTCLDDEKPNLAIRVTTASGQTFDIDEAGSRVTDQHNASEAFGTRFVSQTPEIYGDALVGACGLPSLQDSLRQHRLYLAALRKHFALAEDQPVPVS